MRVGAGGFHANIRRHLATAEDNLAPTMRALLEHLFDDVAKTERRVKAVKGMAKAYASQDAVGRQS